MTGLADSDPRNRPDTDACLLAGCPGLNPDRTCPNGYGVTCEAVRLPADEDDQ